MWQSYGGDTLHSTTYLSRVSSSKEIRVHYVSALGTDNLKQTNGFKYWQADGIQKQIGFTV